MYDELLFQAAATGLKPNRPVRIYPAHSFRYDDHVESIVQLLKPTWKHGEHYILTAPRRHAPVETGGDNAALATFLIQSMNRSDLIWAFAGGYASRSAWIAFENAYAEAASKPAVAIVPRGQERISQTATANSTREELGWNCQSIIKGSLRALPPETLRSYYSAGSVLLCMRSQLDQNTLAAIREELRLRRIPVVRRL